MPPGSPVAREGIVVLVKDELQIEDIMMENVVQGNLSRFSFTMKDKKYLLNCLYVPNEDMRETLQHAQFYEEVFDDRMYGDFNHILYAGDYNVALNYDLDTCGYLNINNRCTT